MPKTENGAARVVTLTTVAVAALEEFLNCRHQLRIKKKVDCAPILRKVSPEPLEA